MYFNHPLPNKNVLPLSVLKFRKFRSLFPSEFLPIENESSDVPAEVLKSIQDWVNGCNEYEKRVVLRSQF